MMDRTTALARRAVPFTLYCIEYSLQKKRQLELTDSPAFRRRLNTFLEILTHQDSKSFVDLPSLLWRARNKSRDWSLTTWSTFAL